jgi:hypothetical protein
MVDILVLTRMCPKRFDRSEILKQHNAVLGNDYINLPLVGILTGEVLPEQREQ